MPVDPYGYEGPYAPEYYPLPVADQYYQDSYRPFWYDLGIEAIRRGAETAQIVASGYPGYPEPQQIMLPPPPPQVPPPGTPPPGSQPKPSGLQVSTNTLIIGAVVVLAFVLGKKR